MECRSYIGGEWQRTSGADIVKLGNPARPSSIVSRTSRASVEDAIAATTAAAGASEYWSRAPVEQRYTQLRRLLDKLDTHGDAFAAMITAETGKTRTESRAEVTAAIAESRMQLEIIGNALVVDLAGNEVRFEPLGAVLLVTPFNFPLAALLRKLVPALLAGNTVVAKVSELVPATSTMLFQIIDDCGFVPGVVNLVLADGRAVVAEMLDSTDIKAVSLTGSSVTGEAIATAIGGRNIRLQAEMGGSNVVVVLADANLQDASDAVVRDGFACCGQWCTGTTRVVVDETVLDAFKALLLQKAAAIAVGDGEDPATNMGPLISAKQRDEVTAKVQTLCERGAELLCGGCGPLDSGPMDGYFFEPTVLLIASDSELRVTDEIFGPVLVLIGAVDADDAIARANDSPYGLSASVFTQDTALADRFVRESNTGLCHVNMGTSVRDFSAPLAGWGRSGRGPAECGIFARDFYTRPKAVYRAI